MTTKQQEMDWAIGQAAYSRRMHEALRDRSMWVAQITATLTGLLKLTSGILAVAVGLAALGIHVHIGVLVALVISVPALLIWPSAFRRTFPNLFCDAADEAFTNALTEHRSKSKGLAHK